MHIVLEYIWSQSLRLTKGCAGRRDQEREVHGQRLSEVEGNGEGARGRKVDQLGSARADSGTVQTPVSGIEEGAR